ncbi:MAG: hypothetical protein Q4E06_12150 [Lautropia sp.]|nr:hypothetical protein [Lautropia sp.]
MLATKVNAMSENLSARPPIHASRPLRRGRRVSPSLAAAWALLLGSALPLTADAGLVADPGQREASAPFVIDTTLPQAPTVSARDGEGFSTLAFAAAQGASTPGWLVIRPRQGHWNWAKLHSLRLHVQNIMPWPVTLLLQLRDDQGRVLDASVGLMPGAPFQLSLPLAATLPLQMGMRAAPPNPWMAGGVSSGIVPAVAGQIDRARISEVRIGMPPPDAEQKIRLGKIFLPDDGSNDLKAAYTGIVDAWGQYTRGQWPGKYVSAGQDGKAARQDEARERKPRRTLTRAQQRAAERAQARRREAAEKAEMAAFARHAKAADQALDKALAAQLRQMAAADAPRLDRYGGITGLQGVQPDRGKPGYFRTARLPRRDGSQRHVLLTPEGNPFFSIGINAVQRDNSETFIGGREFQFTSLPDKDSPLHAFRRHKDSTQTLPADSGAQRERRFLKGETFNFYQANLYRRDGEAWAQRWVDRTPRRLKAWGFNTAGAWSDESILTAKMPHTRILHVEGPFARLSDGHNWWSGIPDPFDPAFGKALEMQLQKAAIRTHDDPWLIGWFIDNELGWGDGSAADPVVRYALAWSALQIDAAAPQAHAKRAFVRMLRERYGDDVGQLAAAWQQPLTDWAAIEAALPAERRPDARRPAVAADLSAFLRLHAESYFSQVAQALERHAPNHLYLGSRFASRTPEAMAACARWCDVVSFNLYIPNLREGFEHQALARLDKPALLTEFHFGSSDRGPFWPGVQVVNTEAERGPAYQRMLESVVANPQFVGAHWFQYLDQPVTGRWLDGENGHLGLVGITDVPWHDFVLSVARTNRQSIQTLGQQALPRDDD